MTFDRPPDFSRRGWAKVQKAAMQAAAEHWHAAMLPRHFEHTARGRYGYQPRTEKYQRGKVRAVMAGRARSAKDLIHSGLTKDSAMKRPLIKAFPTRARLDLLAPPYISMKPDPRGRRKAAPAMGDELTRVTFEEAEELAEVAVAFCESRIGTVRDALRSVSVTTSAATTANWPAEWSQSYTVICE